MTFSVILQYAVEVVLAAGGCGGLVALLSARSQRRKLRADIDKVEADADKADAETHATRINSELSILAAYRGGFDHLTAQLTEANAKIDVLTNYIGVLVQLLRGQDITVPDMPALRPLSTGAIKA